MALKNDSTDLRIEKDRYASEDLVIKWKEADKSTRIIIVNDIEIEGYEEEYNEMAMSFFENIAKLDNTVQQFCIDAYCEGREV